MLKRIRRFLIPPVFEDQSRTRLASLLNTTIWSMLGISLLYFAAMLPQTPRWYALTTVVLVDALQVGVLLMMRRGRVLLACHCQTAVLWTIVTLAVLTSGGITSGGAIGYTIVILLAALLMGPANWLAIPTYTLLSVAAGLGISLLEVNGALPASIFGPILPMATWTTHLVVYVLLGVLLHLAVSNIGRAFDQARQSQQALAESNRQLQARTAELERHEIALLNSEARNQALLRAIPDMLFEVDRQGLLLNFFLGQDVPTAFRFDQFIGRPISEAVPRELTDWAMELIAHVLDSGETEVVEFQYPAPDRTHDYEGRIVPCGPDSILGIVRDITERKETTRELEMSEQQYRTTLNSMADAIHVVDKGLGIVLFNQTLDEWCKRLGLETNIIGKTIQQAFSFLSEQVIEEYKRVFESREMLLTEETQQIGGQDWITESRKIPILDGQGEVSQVVTVIRDITRRKQAQEALQQSENRFRSVVEHSLDGIILQDAEANIVFANPASTEILGYTLDEFLALPQQSMVPPDQWPILLTAEERRSRGQADHYEVEVLHKDGRRIPLLISSAPRYENDRFIGTVTVFTDITERKRIEEKIRESEEKYRTLVETLREVIYELDPEGTVTYISPSIEEFLEYPPEQVIGQDFRRFIHPEDILRIQEGAQAVLQGQSVSNEYRGLTRSGQTRWMHTFSQPIVQGEQIVGLRGILTDITKRRQAEDRLLQSEQKYRQLVENLSNVIYEVSADGIMRYVNPVIEVLLGYTPAEVEGHHFGDFVPAEDLARMYESMQQTLSGQPTTNEHRIRTKSGQERWVRAFNQPICQEGAITGIRGVISDITEQKLADEKLRQSEARLRTAMESLPFDFFVVDSSGHYSMQNSVCREHWGDVIGRRPQDVAPDEETRSLWLCNNQRAFSGQTVEEEVSLKVHGEERFYVNIITPIHEHERIEGILGVNIDITRRKQAEQKLRQSEERYRAIAESVFVHAWSVRVEPDGSFIPDWISEGWTDFIGYTTEELIVRGGWEPLIHPEDLPIAIQHSQVHLTGQPDVAEFRIVVKSGEVRWIREYGMPIWDDKQGRVIRIYGAVQDITQRKLAELALQRSNERLRLLREIDQDILAAESPESIARVALEGVSQLIPCQIAAVVDFGLAEEEISLLAALSDSASRFVAGGRYAPYTAEARAALEQGQPHLVQDLPAHPHPNAAQEILLAEGIRSYALFPLMVQDELVGSLNIAMGHPGQLAEEQLEIAGEIADSLALAVYQARLYEQIRHHAEELEQRIQERTAELQASEAKLRAQYKAIPVPTYTWQKSGDDFVLVDYNDAAVEITRGGIADYLNARCSEMYRDMPQVLEDMTHCVEEQTSIEWETSYYFRTLGEARYMTIKYAFAPPDQVLVHTEDISERKRAEQELQERTAQLEALNQELEAFTYSVSHDLRAPLFSMRGFAQALLEDYGQQVDQSGRNYIQRINNAAQRMENLIQDLLTYSRIGRTEVLLEAVSLAGIMPEVLSMLDASIKQSGAQVHIEQPLPSLVGHRSILVQVISNLLSNALKFVAPDAQPRVRLWTQDRGEWLRLWVEDNGIGIAPEYHKRIFRVFERLHSIEAYPGTGIGLAIVQKGVERMGGRVGVESVLDQGSKFWIELPKFQEKR